MNVNVIPKEVIWLLIGVVSTLILVLISKIAKNANTKVSGETVFVPAKFTNGMLGIADPIGWAKDITQLFNIRKLIVYAIIIGMIFAFGFWKGNQETPVKIDLGEGKECHIKLDGHYLHIAKDGSVTVEDKDGKILKRISVKDIPELSKKLKPYGFQLKPILVAGCSMGTNGTAGGEIGAGVSFFKFFKAELDAFVTTHPAAYLGASYSLEDMGLENTSVGVAVGKSLSDFDDTRVMVYGKIKF